MTVSAISIAGCADETGGQDSPSTTATTVAPTTQPTTETIEESPTATETNSGTTTTSTAESGGQRPTTIEMVTTTGDETDYYFDPIGLLVTPGSTITFKNAKGSHSSTAYKKGNGPASVTRIPSQANAWDSGILNESGATFEHTFEAEGTYDYFCLPHKSLGMVGRIVVGSSGGPAAGSMPPDGKVPKGETIVNQGVVTYNEFKN